MTLKTKLKPYVFKIKGAKNWALYDLLNGNFFTITPQGDLHGLQNAMEEAGLTFKTRGVVPAHTRIDFSFEKEIMKIRELEIRINGREEDTCWQRQKTSADKHSLSPEQIRILKDQLRHIPVKEIRIEGETDDPEHINYIIREFKCDNIQLFIEQGINRKQIEAYKRQAGKSEKQLTFLDEGRRRIKALTVKIDSFFYNQVFNPCWGQKVSIDSKCQIKPCLWSQDIIETITSDHLVDLMNSGAFDKYWEVTKDVIESCAHCELRYACFDCRVCGQNNEGKHIKPDYCRYSPESGDIQLEDFEIENGE